MFVTYAISPPTGIFQKINIIKISTVVFLAKMMNNILGMEELNRKLSNITQQKQHLPINNKVNTFK
jgi:uncharacterized membrane protein YjjP (DUF1212 family)